MKKTYPEPLLWVVANQLPQFLLKDVMLFLKFYLFQEIYNLIHLESFLKLDL
jgi:hypothetical protein